MCKEIKILALMAFLLVTQAHAGGCLKTARWNNDPPYALQSKNGEIHGIHPDLIREIMKRMPCEVKFVEMPWARALAEVKSGRLDLLANAVITPEREEFAYFSRATDASRNVVFVSQQNAKKFKFEKLSDLIGTNFRLGVQIGASYSDEFDALLKEPAFVQRLTQITDLKLGWKMLNAGRLEGQLADEATGLIQIKELGLADSIKVSSLVASSGPSFIAFSKATTDEPFVNQFNAALGTVLADGTYKKIMERYLLCKVSVQNLGCQ